MAGWGARTAGATRPFAARWVAQPGSAAQPCPASHLLLQCEAPPSLAGERHSSVTTSAGPSLWMGCGRGRGREGQGKQGL